MSRTNIGKIGIDLLKIQIAFVYILSTWKYKTNELCIYMYTVYVLSLYISCLWYQLNHIALERRTVVYQFREKMWNLETSFVTSRTQVKISANCNNVCEKSHAQFSMERKLNNKGKMFDYLFLSHFTIVSNFKRKIIEAFIPDLNWTII